MSTRTIAFAALSLAAALTLTRPAAAQTAGGVVYGGSQQVYAERSNFAEAALTSCAGGAVIGYLAVLVLGGTTPGSTAALFCGLSVAATAASSVTAWTWQTATSFIH